MVLTRSRCEDLGCQVWSKEQSANMGRHILSSLYNADSRNDKSYQHTHPFNGPFLGLPRWASTRKVKPIWILLKQETVSGNGIYWAICKSAPRSRQVIMPAPHHSVFYRPDALPATQLTASKHWRQQKLPTQSKIKHARQQPNNLTSNNITIIFAADTVTTA